MIFRFLSSTFFFAWSLLIIFGCTENTDDVYIRVEVIDPSFNGNLTAYVDRGVINVDVEAGISLDDLADGGNGFRVVPLRDTYLIYNGIEKEAFNFFSGSGNTYFNEGVDGRNFFVRCNPVNSGTTGLLESIECRFIKENNKSGTPIDPSITLISLKDTNTVKSVMKDFQNIDTTGTFIDNNTYYTRKYPITIF